MLEYTLEARYGIAVHWVSVFQREPRLYDVPECNRVFDMNREKDLHVLRNGELEEGFVIEFCNAVADCIDVYLAIVSETFWNEKT